jgi:hypothetical protein
MQSFNTCKSSWSKEQQLIPVADFFWHSFLLVKGKGYIVGSGVFNGLAQTSIDANLPKCPNTLQEELYILLLSNPTHKTSLP